MNLNELLTDLDSKQLRHGRLVAYYEGRQHGAFVAPEIAAQLNRRLTQLSVNIPRLVVDTIAERLRITGFDGVDIWPDWLHNDLDTLAGVAHTEALMLGECFAIVWADAQGRPRVTIESATQVTAELDPATRALRQAVKRWEDPEGTHVVLYGPETVTRLHSPSRGAVSGFKTVEVLPNPFGVPPVVRFRNGDRLTTAGISEMLDVLPLTDAIVKLSQDMLISSEYTARPRRWATGLELVEDDDGDAVNPIEESNRAMVSESPETKFGQLPGADLAGYQNALNMTMRLVSAVSGLPEHMLGIGGDNPTSADSIRASEAALVAKAEARQRLFGKSWAQVAALVAAVRTGADPAQIDARPRWADAATRSVAQEADAILKLHSAGILTTAEARERLGIIEGN